MKRPHLVHFLAIKTEDHIAVKASVTMKETNILDIVELEKITPSFPIQSFRLLNSSDFTMKIVGLDEAHNEVYIKQHESDSFGNFYFKIPLTTKDRQKISVLQVYETKKTPGLEYVLGSYIPLDISKGKKIIICDFDKTLVDTKYSTTKEVYKSLTSPLENFPVVPHSVEILREYIKKGFHPFILSASPHFYEDAMRDWLYQNKIFTAGIFLKDYRKIFSLFEGDLTPKDLKIQGLYKLNHLLDILHMTGIPDELTLMGDNFESDPLIYMGLAKMLRGRTEPRKMWAELKSFDAFQLSRKQDSQLLNKIYQLHSLTQRVNKKDLKVEIFIRKKANEIKLSAPEMFATELPNISLYDGKVLDENSGSEKQNIANAEN